MFFTIAFEGMQNLRIKPLLNTLNFMRKLEKNAALLQYLSAYQIQANLDSCLALKTKHGHALTSKYNF